MTAKPSYPIRAMHCIQWQLESLGNAGSTALGLLKFQSSSYYSQLPKNLESPKVWELSRKVLDIKLTNQCSHPLDAFKNIKDRAATGVKPVPERDVLYAMITVADSLSPENVPLRIACALHLGGLIPWEIENDANCYELVEHAVDLFLAQRKVGQSRDHERFDFVFQGGSFHARHAVI